MRKMVTGVATKLLHIKMFLRFLLRLCLFTFIVQLVVIFIYNAWFNHLWEQTMQMFSNGMSISLSLASTWKFEEAAKMFFDTCGAFLQLQKFAIIRSCWTWLLVPMIVAYMYLSDEDEIKGREYIQGRKYITPDVLNALAHKINKFTIESLKFKKCLPLGDVYLPVPEEIKQTFVVGKPGCGKTNLFNQVILKIRARLQKLIIHDFKGDYVEKFYNPDKDILFNPLDMRSVGWCLFNDCQSVMDIEGFASALIPPPVSGDPFWNNSARDILVGILRYCYESNQRTNQDIWDVATLPNAMLYEVLSRTRGGELGAKHLEDPTGKTALGIMSNLMQYVKSFEYLAGVEGDFSINEWIKNKDESATIFITNYAKLQYTLAPMISLFIQTVGNSLLSESDDLDNRVFFILDEFGQLPNMSTIQSLMTASRSKGGSVFIGVQDIGQLDRIYKKDTRTTILNSASNRIMFNCKDHDTAKFFSLDIGETEYYEDMESQSLGTSAGDRVNTSRQRRKEALVTPEDIQSLPDLNAFVSIGHYDVTLSKWKYKKLDKIGRAFIQRANLDLSNVVDVNPNFDPNQSIEEVTHQPVVNNGMVSNLPSDYNPKNRDAIIPATLPTLAAPSILSDPFIPDFDSSEESEEDGGFF